MSNAGDVDIVGMELEAVIVPTADLDILIGFGWLDGKVESDNLLFDEKEPALAPEISLNAVVQYTFPVDLLGGNVSLSSSVSYLDDYFITPENQPTMVQDGHVLWNARLNWTSASGRFSVEGFVDNVLNEEYAVGAFSVGDFAYNAFIWGKPRWAGIRIAIDHD